MSALALPALTFPMAAEMSHAAPETGTPALELFATVPPWAIVHAARDNRNAPLICQGEVVVIEGGERAGWYPTEGGLFLAEHTSTPSHGGRFIRRYREVVQTYRNRHGDWHCGAIRRGVTTDGRFYCSDGPYQDECHLAEKLIGKVVGLLSCTLVAGRA